jgi:hypothetical protein
MLGFLLSVTNIWPANESTKLRIQEYRVCWLLETSVRTVDDFTYDFFIFLGTAVLTDEELKQEHFSCLPP